MSPRRRPALALALALALAGLVACEPDIVVELAPGAQTLPAPRFVLRAGDGAAPRVDSVRVYDVTEGQSLIWHLRASPPGRDVGLQSLTYGETPPGYEAALDPRPLAPGRSYAVIASGQGHGQLRFGVDAQGRAR